jgi:hypothetical protein
MKAKNLCTCAGLCAGFASMAIAGGDKPTPQLLENGTFVQPVKIAKCRYENGQVVKTSEWMDYKGGARGSADERVFDCYGDADSDGFMDDTGGCGLSSSRWYFGTGYCNGMATNDMVLDGSTNLPVGLGRADFGWYWTCGGSGAEECNIAIFTQESDPTACAADSFDYSGWLISFGTLSCNTGFYYYTNVDISATGTWPAPTGGAGSYVYAFLTSGGAALATCAQPMLWGDGVNDGGAVANPRGSQETEQLDDDNLLDGTHSVPTECYTYSLGVCPNPLGAMLQFWGERGNACAFADCDGNGVVDTRDFTCYLNRWVPKNPLADCDGNQIIDTRDFICFLNLWTACR